MANATRAHAPPSAITPKRLAAGFIAGFLAVLVFHQIMLAILYAIGFTGHAPYPMAGVPPLSVPAVISAAFWGGLWGIIFAAIDRSFPRGGGYWVAAILFGAIPLSLVAWFIVAPIKGAPMAAGGEFAGLITALLVNGAWGLGTGLFLGWLTRGPMAD